MQPKKKSASKRFLVSRVTTDTEPNHAERQFLFNGHEIHVKTRKYKFLNNFFVFLRGFRGNNFYLYQVKEVLNYFSTRKRVPW